MKDATGRTGGGTGSAMARLREETWAAHRALEALPYFKMLAEHRLPLSSYLAQLRALAVLHAVLESQLSACDDVAVRAVWREELRKLPWLERDLAFFAPRAGLDAEAPLAAALALADEMRRFRATAPRGLLGFLYVFEGSTLGNDMHRPDLVESYHLRPGEGTCYYASYGTEVRAHWGLFSERMNAALVDPASHPDLLAGARAAFDGLGVLYRALYPLDSAGVAYHIARINPEAGNHPMPQDEGEIQAALSASAQVWAEFPYFQQRYGARGRRFSDSDACWLATLAQYEASIVRDQVEWIARVLASRGMPSVLLERCLCCLAEELGRAVPEKTAEWDRLRLAADALRHQREDAVPAADVQTLARRFGRLIGAARMQDPDAVVLLAAAWADERNGRTGAVAALTDWWTDSSRFPAEWVDAVRCVTPEV